MKKLLYFFAFFLFACSACVADSDKEVILYWLNEVANGIYDLKQPLFPSAFGAASRDYVLSFREMNSPNKNQFLGFIQATDGTSECWFRAAGDSSSIDRGFFFDSRPVAKETIAKVLNRRLPIINNFAYDKKKYSEWDPKYICRGTENSSYDYLGLFQIRVVIILFVSGDFRFLSEAEALLNYVKTPRPKSKNWWEKIDQEALLCYTSDTREWLPRFLVSYIYACKAHENPK